MDSANWEQTQTASSEYNLFLFGLGLVKATGFLTTVSIVGSNGAGAGHGWAKAYKEGGGDIDVCADSSQTLRHVGSQTQFLSLLGAGGPFFSSLDEEGITGNNKGNR